MAIKPTLLPISPNDARAAIRLHNTLESDIARLREDLRRHTCDPLSAQQAIAHKQRQLAQVRAFLRQYHVDLQQFERLEEERRRQARRRQHAIFEDQRRATVPGKNTLVARRARNSSVESVLPPPTIALPPPPAPISPSDSSNFFESTPKNTLELILEASTIDGEQYLNVSPNAPSWRNKGISKRNVLLLQQMLERIYQSRTSPTDADVAYRHLTIVYEHAGTPQNARLLPPGASAPPMSARAFTPAPPATGNPAELAQLRQQQEAMLKAFQDQMNAVRADLEAKNAVIMRGSQAQREQLLALQQQLQAQQEIQRRMNTDVANYAKNDVNQQKALLEKMVEQQKAYQHEISMIQANLIRLAEAAAAEEKMKQEQEAAKQKAMQEEQKKRDAEAAQKKKDMAKAQDHLRFLENELTNMEGYHKTLKMQLEQIDREMQHAKISNPQMSQQLSLMRNNIIQETQMVEQRMGPLRSEVQMARKALEQFSTNLGGMDTTAGLRAWHRDLLTTKTDRRVSQEDKKMLRGMLDEMQVPQHMRDEIWNAVARYESGAGGNLAREINRILDGWMEAQKQEQAHAAALGGTKRFIQHGKASVAQNNYYRMRAIQQTEDAGKEAQNAASQQQAQKATDLSGMFPQLRSAVGRMVGN